MATVKEDAESNVNNAAVVQDCMTDLQQSGQTQCPPPSVLDKILAFLEDINKRLGSLEHLPGEVDGIKASIRHVGLMLSRSDEKYNAQGDYEPKIKEASKRSMPSLDEIDHQASEVLDKDDGVQHYSAKKRVKQTPIWNEDTDIILELSDDDVKEVTKSTVTPHAQRMTFIQRRLAPGSGVPTNLPRPWEKGKSCILEFCDDQHFLIIFFQLPENDIRIRTVTELVLGDCNERKKIIEAKSATYWKSSIDNGY